jgi:glycosyltransferase involved in cell wall biosynthesis
MNRMPGPVAEARPSARVVGDSVSVIICAYTLDRWDDLVRAVESVRDQTYPALETIVVIDGNEELKRRAEERIEGVAVLMNTHAPGLSGGRLTGGDHASGAILAFLDDDAIADDVWLEEMHAAYEDPKVLGAGGRVDPLWETERPAWFPAEFDWVIGCTYVGLPIDDGRIRSPIGANMSMWADVLRRTGTFAPELSRLERGKSVSGTAEETEFCIRAANLYPGRYWVYRPRARVRHAVPAQRATWRFFLRRCRVEGDAKGYLTALAGTRDGLRSERAYVRSVLPRAVAREIAGALRGRTGGLRRAGAIIVGLAATTWAYGRTRALLLTGARRIGSGA